MKKILIPLLAVFMAGEVWAAQTAITQLSTVTSSRQDLRGQVNSKLATIESNRQDFVTQIGTKADTSCFADSSAFNACFALDWPTGLTFDQAGNYTLTGSWDFSGATVTGISGGSYTLPTASAETLGGIKVGNRLTITDGVLSADVQTTDISGKQDTLVSGDNIKTINSTSLLGSGNISISGTMTWPASDSTYYGAYNEAWSALTAAGIPVVDSGGYFTGTNTETVLAELGTFKAATPTVAWDSATLTDTVADGVHTISVKSGVFQAADGDLDTWATVTPSDNGKSLVAAANYAAMRGLLDLEAGTDFNAYDANMITWPSAVSAAEVGYLDGLTGSIATSLSVRETVVVNDSVTLATDEIAANTCSLQPFEFSNVIAATDRAVMFLGGRLSTVAGYGVTNAGSLRVEAFIITDGYVHVDVCNPTSAPITPGTFSPKLKVLR